MNKIGSKIGKLKVKKMLPGTGGINCQMQLIDLGEMRVRTDHCV